MDDCTPFTIVILMPVSLVQADLERAAPSRIDWTVEMVEKLKVAVAQGMGNPEIAKQLGVSVVQVKNKRKYMAQLAKVRAGRNEMEGLESGPTYSILKSFKQKGWMMACRSQ